MHTLHSHVSRQSNLDTDYALSVYTSSIIGESERAYPQTATASVRIYTIQTVLPRIDV